MNGEVDSTNRNDSSLKLVDGVDFYFENGLMVLTAKFLSERGYCCGNLCRHCPYSKEEQDAALKKKLL
jgi:hypothetical protein